MATNRIEVLKAMVAQNPGDAFARYGLAMEFVKSGELESAVGEFRTLLEHNPNYAAAYFHGGQALEKLGDVEQARTFYENGVEVTSRTGDQHARSELQAALDMLPI
jgi:tetratricopeptide (TPR) repeat protein